ncbi:MAG: hypothetical protein NTW86_11935 [Candidatus Sumerlaeota bacterium]|nr:hypothetical protein [Candidatus Sumerlaeota bacterium]
MPTLTSAPETVVNLISTLSATVEKVSAGIAGSWFYGLLGLGNFLQVAMPTSRAEFPFGSFGGYLGVILRSVLMCLLLRTLFCTRADAFVPGIVVGGAIARLAGLFSDANPGILIPLDAIPWFQTFRLWAVYDIAIHGAVLLPVLRLCRRHDSTLDLLW